MGILTSLRERELVQDISDTDDLKGLSKGDGCYVGLDPTAPSLQIGNLVPLLVSIHLGRAGLKPLILFGGATGSIGDPSGKSEERQLLPRETIEENVTRQRQKALEIFNRAGVHLEFVNNWDWTHSVSILDFLRDIGKHFTVNYMIAKEVVKTRLNGDGISFTEFSYMLLQAFDFAHLYTHRNVRLQFGGSDQWGNITAGLELIRRKALGDAYAFSFPLITDRNGKKFGKSEGGAVWLDGAMTSPFKFHQFWLNVEDQEVIRFLKVFTLLPLDEIRELESTITTSPEKRLPHNRLADAVTELVHGAEAVASARRSAQVLFGGSVEGLKDEELLEIFSDVPSKEIPRTSLANLSVVDLLVESGAVKSKGEARRLIEGGGAYINSERVATTTATMADSPFLVRGVLVLRTGKKSYHLVKVA